MQYDNKILENLRLTIINSAKFYLLQPWCRNLKKKTERPFDW